jgi:hypothetical protein
MECIILYLLWHSYFGEDMGVEELDEVHDAVEQKRFDLKGGWKEDAVLFVDLVKREESWCDAETEDDETRLLEASRKRPCIHPIQQKLVA